jgi:hypothetical protein
MSEGLVIDWTPDCSLKWSDFKAESNPSVYEDSHSVVKYRFTWTVNSDIVDKKIMFLIDNILLFVEFHPLLSWIRSESNAGLLLHEQGCFDLAELVKRENFTNLQDQFYHKYYPTRGQNEEQRKQFAKEDSGKMIASEIEKLQKLYDEKRKKYQEDTNFGQNFDEQSKYDLLFKQLRQ